MRVLDVPEPEKTPPQEPPRGRRFASANVWMVLGLGLGMGALATWAALAWTEGASSTHTDEKGLALRDATNILVAVQDLAKLESVTYHLERVIDLQDSQKHLFGLVEVRDAILLVAAVDVTAGVDFTDMRDGDIVLDQTSRTARIRLPPPKILWARLDSRRTYVHSRHTDLLAKKRRNLEQQARLRAEGEARQAALDGAILERAKRNAETTLTQLVRAFGYRAVVEWPSSPSSYRR